MLLAAVTGMAPSGFVMCCKECLLLSQVVQVGLADPGILSGGWACLSPEQLEFTLLQSD